MPQDGQMSDVDRAQLEARALRLGEGPCNNRVILDAQAIADPDVRGPDTYLTNGTVVPGQPGNPANVYALLPQLAADYNGARLADVSNQHDKATIERELRLENQRNRVTMDTQTFNRTVSERIMCPDNRIGEDEVTGALIVAARIANERHIALKDVPMADIASGLPVIVGQIKGVEPSMCRANPNSGGRGQ